MAPSIGSGILTRRLPDIARLGIEHLRLLDPRAAAILLRERRRCRRDRLVPAIREDEGVVAGAARRSGHCRKAWRRRWWLRGTAGPVNRRPAIGEALVRPCHVAHASTREADPHIDLVLEVVGANEPARCQAALTVARQDDVLEVFLVVARDDEVVDIDQ